MQRRGFNAVTPTCWRVGSGSCTVAGLDTRAGIEFRILGPLEVLDFDRVVTVGGARQRALLAVLLLHANETLSGDRLADELWGDRPPATAAKTVQVYISRLRRALGDGGMIATREHGYELQVDPECLDAHRFERLLGEGRSELAAGRPAPGGGGRSRGGPRAVARRTPRGPRL